MRIGWILARGSCGALKWLALFGVVFALGAGSASAQLEYDGPGTVLEVNEGSAVMVKWRVKATLGGSTGATTLSFQGDADNTVTLPAGTASTVGGDGKPTLAEGGSQDLSTVQAVTVSFPANGNTQAVKNTQRGTFFLSAAHDADAEDEIVYLSLAVTNAQNIDGDDGEDIASNTSFVLVKIIDDEKQGFNLDTAAPVSSTNTPTEGTAFSVKVQADPPTVQKIWTVNFRLPPGYTPTSPPATITGGNESEFTIVPPNNDQNRTDDKIMLELYDSSGSGALSDPLELTFEDIHGLPDDDEITWEAFTDDDGKPSRTETDTLVEGGDPVHVTVTLDRGTGENRPDAEDLKVTPVLMGSARSSDYQIEGLTGGALTIARHATNTKVSGTFMVYALDDDDITAEPEELMFDLRVEGTKTGNGPGMVMAEKPVMLMIEDATEALLTPMSADDVESTVMSARTAAAAADGNDLFTPGEMFSVMGSALFEGSNVAVSASADGDAVSVSTSGGTVTVTAMSVGMAMVTVTGTVASTATTSQTIHNIAQVMFDVTVDELPLEITLSGADGMDMNITEGMSATVTATANRAVTANTMVDLVLTGGSASPDDYTVEDLMIMDGQMTGEVMLTAVDDMLEERMETMTIEGRFGDGMETNALTFNIWDAAVPALPVIAQLLLAGLLAVGGWRRYLRR